MAWDFQKLSLPQDLVAQENFVVIMSLEG